MNEALERWLDRAALAKRLCTSPACLPRLVSQGRLPQPSLHLGPRSPRWDIHAVDAMMLDAVGVSMSLNTEMAVARACEEISSEAKRSKGRPKDAR